MRIPEGLAIGCCSHTGMVRSGNEDDYLLATLPIADGVTFLAAIADGMGGVAGGSEASRTALRGLAATIVDVDVASGGAGMTEAFRSASERVFESANAVPALRDMGTTLTAIWLVSGRMFVGHVGDSRLYRVRGNECAALTKDHAVREGESLLTRCVGGGQISCEVDVAEFELEAGDRYVLATDGVWNVIPPNEFAALVGKGDANQVADSLVQRAIDHGGPDNATCVVVDVVDPQLAGGIEDRELSRHERPEAQKLWPQAESLRTPVWPWLVCLASAMLLAYSGLTLAGVDVAAWLP